MSLVDTLLMRRPPERALVPIEAAVLQAEAKAVSGFGTTALTYSPPAWSMERSPQKMSYQAAMLFRDHDTIHEAESAVSDRAGKVEWHLEVDEVEVDDTSPPAWRAARDLLERPQAALPRGQRQPGMLSRRGLWTKTLRHMGLCGYAFWHLDQTDALAGIPLAILYIDPWRMYSVENKQGVLLGWALDKPLEDGGTPLRVEDVLAFYLNAPDRGHFSSGLVQAAQTKIPLGPLTDRHIANVLASGGRLAGMISPKVGSVITEENWAQFIRDYRQITQDPSAALKLQIVQGAVDYVRTAATMDEMALMENDKRVRDAIMELWGVPGSQSGAETPAGLNSGSTKDKDEAVLWQGAIDTRLTSFYETVQYELLDRYKAAGISIELVLTPPQFDDDAPQYDKAQKAEAVPMTANERRAIVNLPPLEGELAQFGERLTWKTGWVDVDPSAPLQPPPPPVPPVAPQTASPDGTTDTPPAKAQLPKFAALRRQVDERAVPRVKRSVLDVLTTQKAEIIRYLRQTGLDHLRRKVDFRWNAAEQDRRLEEALAPDLRSIAGKVAVKTRTVLASGKAAAIDDFTDEVVTRVLTKGAGRVKGINATTRQRTSEAIAAALESAETITEVIAAVDDLEVFGELRAETIARTESMFAYNDAALSSYEEMGIAEVEAIDGDEDDVCAERDGQVFTIEEAASIEDHPNGTLDWVPIVPDEEPPQKAIRTEIERDAFGRVVAVTELADTPYRQHDVSA